MRIPISTADWPASFNATAKYIGRHWPSGKLKLSRAREVTAKLMGYNSVHDLKQELLPGNPSNSYSIRQLATSMSVKAVLLFEQDPINIFHLFADMPWTNLSIWKHTLDYKTQQTVKQGKLLLVDEYHSAMNYYTPILLASAWQQGKIPKYEFTVDEKGLMFHRAQLETLLESLIPTEEDLSEQITTLTVEQYFDKHILPLAQAPIDQMIVRQFPNQPLYWLTPDHIKVLETQDNHYALYHEKLSAFYPGTYTSTSLLNAITSLFILDEIDKGLPSPNVTFNDVTAARSSIQKHSSNSIFTFRGQTFYRRYLLNDYSTVFTSPFFDYLSSRITHKPHFDLPDSVLPKTHLLALNRAFSFNKLLNSSPDEYPASFSRLDKQKLFKTLFDSSFYDVDTLISLSPFDLTSQYFEDEHEELEAVQNLEKYSDQCDQIGQTLIDQYPFLSDYYHPRVIGHLYSEWNPTDETDVDESLSQIQLSEDFWIELLTHHLAILFNTPHYGFSYRIIKWLLVALEKEQFPQTEFTTNFSLLLSFNSAVQHDISVFEPIQELCSTPENTPMDGLVNYGSPYKPTFKQEVDDRNQIFIDSLRRFRKVNTHQVAVSQAPLSDNSSE